MGVLDAYRMLVPGGTGPLSPTLRSGFQTPGPELVFLLQIPWHPGDHFIVFQDLQSEALCEWDSNLTGPWSKMR